MSRFILVTCVLAIGVGFVFAARQSRTTTNEVSVQDVAIDADGRTVWATVYTDSYGKPDRLVFAESTTEVLVTALVRQRSGDCESIGLAHRISGSLAAPLGSRALRSGA